MTKKYKSNRAISLLTILLLLGGFTTQDIAQSKGIIHSTHYDIPLNGRAAIVGKVVDAKNKEPMPGVNILVANTSFGQATDLDGEYQILGILPGTYTFRASDIGLVDTIGYKTAVLSNIKLRENQLTVIDFELADTVIAGRRIVISYGPISQPPMQIIITDISKSDINNYFTCEGIVCDSAPTQWRLKGVNVILVGAKRVIATDQHGKFIFDSLSTRDTLLFQYYRNQSKRLSIQHLLDSTKTIY